mmetsp:Transcript_98337/g.184868  ORF Transcript_98337/g.184868 Transcript_98337/m.184868 type:complete len:200 (+) Transcript_98337:343-942(+)
MVHLHAQKDRVYQNCQSKEYLELIARSDYLGLPNAPFAAWSTRSRYGRGLLFFFFVFKQCPHLPKLILNCLRVTSCFELCKYVAVALSGLHALRHVRQSFRHCTSRFRFGTYRRTVNTNLHLSFNWYLTLIVNRVGRLRHSRALAQGSSLLSQCLLGGLSSCFYSLIQVHSTSRGFMRGFTRQPFIHVACCEMLRSWVG